MTREAEATPEAAAKPFEWTPILFTAASVLMMLSWQAFPSLIPFLRHDLWLWFVFCGVVFLSFSRFSIQHVVPLPELWLLSFPFLFELFFQRVIPTSRVASFDELLWTFDFNFGYPQPFLGKLIVSNPLLFWLCKVTWSSLPLLFVVVYLALPSPARRRYVRALVATACLLLPLYALCPGAGPNYLFGDQDRYLNSLPIPLLHPVPANLPPGLLLNTTPSGHVAWALLLCCFCFRYTRRMFAATMTVISVVIAISTLALGERYVIDLILSVPFAAAIWSLVAKAWARFAVLLTITVVWLCALREGWLLGITAPVIWIASAATLASCLIAPRYFKETSDSPKSESCSEAPANQQTDPAVNCPGLALALQPEKGP